MCWYVAYWELLGMASAVLHSVHSAGGILCAKHVCGSGGGELPPLSWRAGEGRKSQAVGKESEADGEEEKE